MMWNGSSWYASPHPRQVGGASTTTWSRLEPRSGRWVRPNGRARARTSWLRGGPDEVGRSASGPAAKPRPSTASRPTYLRRRLHPESGRIEPRDVRALDGGGMDRSSSIRPDPGASRRRGPRPRHGVGSGELLRAAESAGTSVHRAPIHRRMASGPGPGEGGLLLDDRRHPTQPVDLPVLSPGRGCRTVEVHFVSAGADPLASGVLARLHRCGRSSSRIPETGAGRWRCPRRAGNGPGASAGGNVSPSMRRCCWRDVGRSRRHACGSRSRWRSWTKGSRCSRSGKFLQDGCGSGGDRLATSWSCPRVPMSVLATGCGKVPAILCRPSSWVATLGLHAPIVQRPRTPPFQGGNTGSNPVGGTNRAPPLHRDRLGSANRIPAPVEESGRPHRPVKAEIAGSKPVRRARPPALCAGRPPWVRFGRCGTWGLSELSGLRDRERRGSEVLHGVRGFTGPAMSQLRGAEPRR